MLGETGAGVAHCPVSNQYGADGVLRLRDLREAGAVVGLGTDGAAYNHRQDLFECMKQAVLVQRMHHLDPGASHSDEALDLATRGGARLMGHRRRACWRPACSPTSPSSVSPART